MLLSFSFLIKKILRLLHSWSLTSRPFRMMALLVHWGLKVTQCNMIKSCVDSSVLVFWCSGSFNFSNFAYRLLIMYHRCPVKSWNALLSEIPGVPVYNCSTAVAGNELRAAERPLNWNWFIRRGTLCSHYDNSIGHSYTGTFSSDGSSDVTSVRGPTSINDVRIKLAKLYLVFIVCIEHHTVTLPWHPR